MHVGFSFDSTEIFLEGMQQDPLDILIELAGGVRSDLNMIDDVYVSMRLQRIGWPTTKDHEIKGLFEANIKHCGLVNVKYEKERYYATQTFGPILKVTARGETSKNAFTRCARTLRNLTLEDAVYRSDLLDTYKTKDYPKFNEIAKTWKDTKMVSPTLDGGKTKSMQA
jgi:phosphoribosylamine-glycine ligase